MNSNMQVENLKNIIEKINLYKKNELEIFGDFKNIFNNIKYCFDMSYSDSFDEKIGEIYNKFALISKVHDNNIVVINRNIDKYLNSTLKVSQIFEDIVK